MIYCSLDAAIHMTDNPSDFPEGAEAEVEVFTADGKPSKTVRGKVVRHYPVPNAPGWAYIFIGELS